MGPVPHLESQSDRSLLVFAKRRWRVRRPRPFVLVIEGEAGDIGATEPSDYLHDQLLLPEWREAFFQLVDATGLVVCLNVHTQHPTYRDVGVEDGNESTLAPVT